MKPTKRIIKAELEMTIAINDELQRQLRESEKLLALLEAANRSNIRERDEAYIHIGRLTVIGDNAY